MAMKPAEILASAMEHVEAKAALDWQRQFLLGILAGAFIAFAAGGSTMAAFNLLADPKTYGLGRCLAGIVFPTGLMLVVLAGGELFTGNILVSIGLFERRVGAWRMVRGWAAVYAGNFIGGLLLSHMFYASGLFGSGHDVLGGVTIRIAAYKASLDFLPALYLGILCNWLVCLAVWMAWGARTMPGKVAAVFLPIWLFITSGFENSIANMYYIPAGIFAAGNPAWVHASGLSQEALAMLTWRNFFLHNLVPVTLGNIVGGSVFVGGAYWLIYRGPVRECQNEADAAHALPADDLAPQMVYARPGKR